jgi:hypothetical protein
MERQRGAYVITVTVEEDREETRQEIVRLILEYSRITNTVVTVS